MPTPQQKSRVQVTVVAVAEGLGFVKQLPVPRQQTLAWAVNASGLYARAPQLRDRPIGVWGKAMNPATQVAAGDRIEVYSPASPQAIQRHRARLKANNKTIKEAADANPA